MMIIKFINTNKLSFYIRFDYHQIKFDICGWEIIENSSYFKKQQNINIEYSIESL